MVAAQVSFKSQVKVGWSAVAGEVKLIQVPLVITILIIEMCLASSPEFQSGLRQSEFTLLAVYLCLFQCQDLTAIPLAVIAAFARRATSSVSDKMS